MTRTSISAAWDCESAVQLFVTPCKDVNHVVFQMCPAESHTHTRACTAMQYDAYACYLLNITKMPSPESSLLILYNLNHAIDGTCMCSTYYPN